ncbi:MAG: hypothetical protein NT062_14375, partial [Proteobacteria bacterium]|nr:hypothetical protein [Pseudomonadota bacterium]
NDPQWGRESSNEIRAWLELDGDLPVGDVFVRVTEGGADERAVDIPASTRKLSAADHRLPLWIDAELRGARERGTEQRAQVLTDRVALSIANRGGVARDVWIEEPIRRTRSAKLVGWWPKPNGKPELGPKHTRFRVSVPPAEILRFGFSLEYR